MKDEWLVGVQGLWFGVRRRQRGENDCEKKFYAGNENIATVSISGASREARSVKPVERQAIKIIIPLPPDFNAHRLFHFRRFRVNIWPE